MVKDAKSDWFVSVRHLGSTIVIGSSNKDCNIVTLIIGDEALNIKETQFLSVNGIEDHNDPTQILNVIFNVSNIEDQ